MGLALEDSSAAVAVVVVVVVAAVVVAVALAGWTHTLHNLVFFFKKKEDLYGDCVSSLFFKEKE